jgi:cytochrome c biogenesis protein CcdA/DsbC/DsbD-like thiol-disulfide interchange protein
MSNLKVLLLLASLLPQLLLAQPQQGMFDPIKWSSTAERKSATEAELIFTAVLDKGWHLYSQQLPEDGPIPTTFTFKDLGGAALKGVVREPKGKEELDPNFGMVVKYFDGRPRFVQKITLSDKAATVKAEVEFMVCDDKRCLPPDVVEFSIIIPAFEAAVPSKEVEQELLSETIGDDQPKLLNPVKWTFYKKASENGVVELLFNASIDEGWHMYAVNMPDDGMTIPTTFNYDTVGFEPVSKVSEPTPITEFDPMFGTDLSFHKGKVSFSQQVRLKEAISTIIGTIEYMVCDDRQCVIQTADFAFDVTGVSFDDKDSEVGSKRSWLGIFIAGFLGGLLALLTPCVFPMLPLTVSFFTKQSKTKAKGISNAVIYGLSIVLIYVSLGFLVTITFGADALNALSTNVWFNLFFFVLLVVFAISFLGAFEITLPSAWVNKADQASDKGGLIGIFFMAFTLSLVSFSCTGPIIGTLLVEAAVNGGVLGPIMGMTGFSLALALPFGVFAAFPGWLNSMPKSGGWLNSVKVSLGLLELALAFKFLSNADLVVQAGLLQRELFLAIWIAIFGTLALYLFGFIHFPHDSKTERIGVTRYLFGLLALVFTIYLVPGMWGAPLKVISGFPPPMFYSESPTGLGGSTQTTPAITDKTGKMVGDPDHCPHGLPCFHDYDEGLAYARESGKPVLLDFTGWACVNCRKMEEQVWSDPRVLKMLRDDFVLISLYVDEKTSLPEHEQIEVKIGDKTKKLRTIGNRWSYFQAARYGTNSQPYYVILDHEERQLGDAAAYDPDIELYIRWLNNGIKMFHQN